MKLISGRLVDFFSIRMLKKLWIVPLAFMRIRNPINFLLTYAGLSSSISPVVLRGGTTIYTSDSVDYSTISVICLSHDYGEIKNNSTVIDIGANIGIFSLFCGRSNSTIYAYEPVPQNYSLLVQNIEKNKLSGKVIPYNMGVDGVDGTRRIVLAQTSQFHSFYSEQDQDRSVMVECVCLKTIFERNNIQHCDVLKIDCEGAEYDIFYQAPSEIFAKIFEIRMEYHNLDSTKNNILELKKHLIGQGYGVVKLRQDSPSSGIIWFRR